MDPSDEVLLEQYRKTRDPMLFKTLIRRFQNRLFNSAFRILGNQEEAEEVVQETCIRIHQSIDQFAKSSSLSFAAWIFRIAHNTSYDIVRNRSRKKMSNTVVFDPTAEEIGENGDGKTITQLSDPTSDPALKVDHHEQSQMIEKMLEQLPDSQRVVLILHDVEGFSYAEIAEIIGEKLGTVRSRLHYGRSKLKELLTPYYSAGTLSQSPR